MDIRAFIERFRHRRRTAPSLYELLPHADALPRSRARFEMVEADDIVGTTRRPSNTTDDFLPIGDRGPHWRDDFRRILQAQDELVTLPPVDLLRVGDRYFVIDGHKRVAAARRTGAILDASVVELRLPVELAPAIQRRLACA